MPTAQREFETSAFRTASTPVGLRSVPRQGGERGQATARGGALSPELKPQVSAQPAPRDRHRIEKVWIAAILGSTACAVAIGVAYLSGCAMLTREGYRHAMVRSDLARQMALAQHFKHRQAVVNTPANIEQKARALGMIHPDEKLTVDAGAVPAHADAQLALSMR